MSVIINNKIEHKNSINEILYLRRKQLRMTQEEVAEKVGVTFMQISHLEKGRRQPKIDTLNKWTKSLKINIIITLEEYD